MSRFAPLALLALAGCGEKVLLPDVDAATFITAIDNPYLPMPIGATWSYEADGPNGLETIEVEVFDPNVDPDNSTKEIQGGTAVVVRDTASVNGQIIEDTHDWYAQDDEGNVWYLGEATCEYDGGDCVDTEGSWEWGQDGALPGVVMWGDPTVDGVRYYQEYYPGHAEDTGEVLALDGSAASPAGTFTDCVETRDSSTLDTALDERKHYCRGLGVVLTEEADVDEVLTGFTGVSAE